MWLIVKDHTAEPGAAPKTNANAAGLSSRRDPDKPVPELPHKFRMKDDDGEIYYEGYCSKQSFAPLDDFGSPNAGCTIIEYQNELGKWEML